MRGVNDPDIVVKRPAESPGGMTVTIFKVGIKHGCQNYLVLEESVISVVSIFYPKYPLPEMPSCKCVQDLSRGVLIYLV